MGGVLVVLALLVAVVWVFMSLFRSRVRRSMDGAGIDLSAELATLKRGAVAAAPKAAALPAAAAAARAATLPGPATAPAKAALGGGLHYLLIYDVGPDFVQRRAALREEHLALAWKAARAGELLLAGALEEPTEQAFLLFRGSREAAQRFAAQDPYVRQGLVKQWRVKQWHTVAGDAAAMPVKGSDPTRKPTV